MADQEQLDVVVTLRDEASATADKVRAAMKRLRDDSKVSARESREQFKGLESIASSVGREISTTIKMLGVQGAFVSGGFVASIAAMAGALGNFARSSVGLIYTAKEVELTVTQFTKFSYAMQSKGLTEEQATASTAKFAQSILDLRRGTRSGVYQQLETSTANGTGAVWAQRVQRMLETDGLPKTQKWVANFINTKFKSSDPNDRFTAEALRKAMGVSQAAIDGIAENLDEFGDVVEVDEKKALGLIQALVKLQIQLDNLKNKVGIALLPAFTKLATMFSEWVSSDKGEEFVKRIKKMVDDLEALDWDSIRQSVTKALASIGSEIKQFVKDVASIVSMIDDIVKTVDKWKSANNAARDRGETPSTPLFGPGSPQKFSDDIWDQKPGLLPNNEGGDFYPPRTISPEYQKWQRKNAESLSGGPSSNIEDRRNEGNEPFSQSLEKRQSKKRLGDQTKKMGKEIQRMVDILRDARGGVGGGSTDGGVSRKNRSPSSGVGGSGGAPFKFKDTYYAPGAGGKMEGGRETSRPNLEGGVPTAGSGLIGPEKVNTPRTLDDVRLGRSSYVTVAQDPSQYGKFHNLGQLTYRSPMDNQVYRLDDVKGYTHDTGSAFRGKPNKRDIAVGDYRGWSSDAASQHVSNGGKDLEGGTAVGFSGGMMQGRGGEDPMSGALFRSMTDSYMKDRNAVDGAMNGWSGGGGEGSASGSLSLDVNVRAPRGTTVDAGVTEGDFIPSDKGITVNREMQE